MWDRMKRIGIRKIKTTGSLVVLGKHGSRSWEVLLWRVRVFLVVATGIHLETIEFRTKESGCTPLCDGGRSLTLLHFVESLSDL